MVIELATKEDVSRIADLYYGIYCHVYKRPNSKRKKEKLMDYVEVRLKRKDYFIYKAIVKNRIIGTIASKPLSSKRGYITGAYVEPRYRRKNVLTKLEKYALEKLKNRGVKIIELDVRSDNNEGVSTWNALGYQIKKRVPGKKADKLVMIKELE